MRHRVPLAACLLTLAAAAACGDPAAPEAGSAVPERPQDGDGRPRSARVLDAGAAPPGGDDLVAAWLREHLDGDFAAARRHYAEVADAAASDGFDPWLAHARLAELGIVTEGVHAWNRHVAQLPRELRRRPQMAEAARVLRRVVQGLGRTGDDRRAEAMRRLLGGDAMISPRLLVPRLLGPDLRGARGELGDLLRELRRSRELAAAAGDRAQLEDLDGRIAQLIEKIRRDQPHRQRLRKVAIEILELRLAGEATRADRLEQRIAATSGVVARIRTQLLTRVRSGEAVADALRRIDAQRRVWSDRLLPAELALVRRVLDEIEGRRAAGDVAGAAACFPALALLIEVR